MLIPLPLLGWIVENIHWSSFWFEIIQVCLWTVIFLLSLVEARRCLSLFLIDASFSLVLCYVLDIPLQPVVHASLLSVGLYLLLDNENMSLKVENKDESDPGVSVGMFWFMLFVMISDVMVVLFVYPKILAGNERNLCMNVYTTLGYANLKEGVWAPMMGSGDLVVLSLLYYFLYPSFVVAFSSLMLTVISVIYLPFGSEYIPITPFLITYYLLFYYFSNLFKSSRSKST